MRRVQSLLYSQAQAGSSDQGSESDQGASGQSSSLNRGGRPQNWFRKTHFKDTSEGHSHNRKKVQCLHCSTLIESRIETLQKHCLKECKEIAPGLRKECETHLVTTTASAKRPCSGLSRQLIRQQEASVGKYMQQTIPPGQQAVLNRKLFLLFCMNGIPFHVADSPYFLDFLQALNKSYKPAGRADAASSAYASEEGSKQLKYHLSTLSCGSAGFSTLRTTLLLREFMCVKAEIQEKLKGQQNITVNLDGWTDNRGHSVYTCNIVFPDRQIAQWACEDVSAESHTGEFLRGDGHNI